MASVPAVWSTCDLEAFKTLTFWVFFFDVDDDEDFEDDDPDDFGVDEVVGDFEVDEPFDDVDELDDFEPLDVATVVVDVGDEASPRAEAGCATATTRATAVAAATAAR